MTFVSYAQNFEDVLLWRALGHIKQGFYIDVGASHPDTDSVTRAFYDRGWCGINVEPVEAAYQRLTASRPRDVNLHMALAATAGSSTFFSVEDTNSGLSTLDPAMVERYGALGMAVCPTVVKTDTLAALCRAHASEAIHFLKIDVEGAERAVLEGADFSVHRPWIVLAEATAPMSTIETHAGWEPLLLDAGYLFVWFDGLNRYYVAQERHAELAAAFRTPVNVFDDFLRAADTEWTRRIWTAESRADAVTAQLTGAGLRAAIAEDRSQAAQLRLNRATTEVARLQHERARQEEALVLLQRQLARLAPLEGRLAIAELNLLAVHRSTSWRLTGPLRRIAGQRRPRTEAGVSPMTVEAPSAPGPVTQPVTHQIPDATPHTAPALKAVHQFHSSAVRGDAITNAMFLTRRVLRELGYESRIFAEHCDPALLNEVHPFADLPEHANYVLILRHSMGHDHLERLLALPVPRVLMYHNITPPELLEGAPYLQRYAALGRQQLQDIRPAVVAALADSEYNALELRQAGYQSVAACALLFDLDAMLARAGGVPVSSQKSPVFTILFVGRVTGSKNQLGLVAAYARFRTLFLGESRLVLVGRHHDPAYLDALLALIRRHSLDTGAVVVTGPVSADELHRRYTEADLYVSASLHEGFGVPLIEAAAHAVPVLAYAAGAVSYTLGIGPSSVLADTTAASLAEAMLALAKDGTARMELARQQRTAITRFSVAGQTPALVAALVQAGATRPADPASYAALAGNARFTIAGHVNGTYSLAEINRSLARAIEAARPETVRVIPIEGDVTLDIGQVPAGQLDAIARLVARPAPLTGPEVVVSQHYPVWVPPDPGDVPLALFFWEESLIPRATVGVLNGGFRGVLAPSRLVAKALIDSGVCVPVRVIGQSPRLEPFRHMRAERAKESCEGRRRSGPFTFLHVSSAFPRKGIDVLLRAWARAFRATDEVRLVIKAFPNPHNTVADDLTRLQTDDPHMAEIRLIDQDLTEPDLLLLYCDADAMVLPSRGEGYNLPAAEALEAGIPVIVTGWGGHMDFVAQAAGVRLVRFRFAPSGSHLAPPFSLWAEPDEDDLVLALKECAAHYGTGRPVVCEPVSHESVSGPASTDLGSAISSFAADLLLSLARPPPRLGWVTTWDVRCGIAEYSRHLISSVSAPGVILADDRTPGDLDQSVYPAWRAYDHGGSIEGSGALPSAILRHDPQALVIQHQPGLIPWAVLPALLQHPALHGRVVCITLHNTQDLLDTTPPVQARAVSALARMSRVVVHTLADLNNLVGLGLAWNTCLVPHGAVASREAMPVRPLSAEDPVRLGCYGFFLPGKGIPELIEALAILRTDWPRATLRLVNAEYPDPLSSALIASCQAFVQTRGLETAVTFETRFLAHDHSAQLLGECDLLVLPYQSSKEGSSASLRTALQAGVPVAVTPLPLLHEAGPAAILLPGLSAAEIAAGIDRALRDQDARSAAVAHAAEWLQARDWAAVGQRWRSMLDALWASGVVVSSP